MKKIRKIICAVLTFFLIASSIAGISVPASAAHSDVIMEGANILYSGTHEEKFDVFAISEEISDGVGLLSNREFILMDSGKQVRLPDSYYIAATRSLNPFSEGLGIIYTGKYPNLKFGFTDTDGNIAIPCEYDEAEPFNEGLAAVRKDGKWGYIDRTGKVIIDFKYVSTFCFSEGLAYVWDFDRGEGFINKSGNEVIELGKYDYGIAGGYSRYGFRDDRLLIRTEEGNGFIDKSGEVVIEPQYISYAPGNTPFSESLAAVAKRMDNGEVLFGYIDTEGNTVIDFQFTGAYAFSNGIAKTYEGWIDRNGRILPIALYDPRQEDSSGARYPSVSYNGKLLVPFCASESNTDNYFYDGLIRIMGSQRIDGFRDKNGTLLIASNAWFNYPVCSNFSEGRSLVRYTDKETGAYVWQIIENPLYADSSKLTASPTPSKVYIDGEETQFEAYFINGNNYFKLRDIAYALNGTIAQFDVIWEEEINAVIIEPGKAYSPVGGEMTGKGEGLKAPSRTASNVYCGDPTEPTYYFETFFNAYNIDYYNYFKLRDIGRELDFNVTWDAATNSILINTTEAYTAD